MKTIIQLNNKFLDLPCKQWTIVLNNIFIQLFLTIVIENKIVIVLRIVNETVWLWCKCFALKSFLNFGEANILNEMVYLVHVPAAHKITFHSRLSINLCFQFDGKFIFWSQYFYSFYRFNQWCSSLWIQLFRSL